MSEDTRKEKFKKLAIKRTRNVLNQLRLLGNLSNKANYQYESEEVRKIFRAIDDQVKTVKSKFKIDREKEFDL